jgi:hypothetical protein
MKNRIYLLEISRQLQQCLSGQDGVFTTNDLKTLLDQDNPVLLFRAINKMEKAGLLQRFIRGIYTAGSPSLAVISNAIEPDSYISFGAVLAKALMIGTVPAFALQAVKVGPSRVYKGLLGTVEHIGIAPHLYFGFETIRGIKYACKEKALLDTLYFHQKGRQFSFDVYGDISIKDCDLKLIRSLLRQYKNPKFRSFAERYVDERAQ